MKKNLYDIQEYTEKELFEILDLNSPTDRELEAKILMNIHKYQDVETKAGKKLVEFFESMYNYFFDDEEEEEEKIEINEEMKQEGLTNMEDNANENRNVIEISEKKPKLKIQNNENKTEESKEDNVIYTQDLTYTKGLLNPILKQTTKRIISIDSQYRSDKNTLSTEFNFNLSEPLKDVVSLRLYSIQIPYTWYTIGKSFGSNFFILKGKTAGIDNDTHDIKMEISVGNYTPQQLIDAVNTAVQDKNAIIDASIGNTVFNYNANTSLSTLNIDIKKQFNQSSYYLSFETWDSPFQIDSNKNTIPGFLGFASRNLYGNVIKSPYYYALEDTGLTLQSNEEFQLTSSNNYIKIIQYHTSFPYSSSSIVDTSLNITFSLQTGVDYTRSALISDLNTQLQNNENLLHGSVERVNIDSSNAEFIGSNKSLIEITAQLSRTYIDTNLDSKTLIELPDDNSMWLGESSCFRFEFSNNEMSYFISDVSAVPQNDIYDIQNSPYIELKCIDDNFSSSSNNDITITLNNSTYTVEEYVSEINRAIKEYDDNNNNVVLNAPASDYVFDVESGSNPTGTFAYVKDNKFNLFLDINKTFGDSDYEISFDNSDIFKEGIIELKVNNSPISDFPAGTYYDLNQNFTAEVSGSLSIEENAKICTVRPKSGSEAGNEGDPPLDLSLNNSEDDNTLIFASYVDLQNLIINYLSSYIDPISNVNIFAGSTLTSVRNNTTSTYSINFNLNIEKKLVGRNYSVQFIQPNEEGQTEVGQSWKINLLLDDSMTDNPFDMDKDIPKTGTTDVQNEEGTTIFSLNTDGTILISAKDAINTESDTLTIQEGVNDTIKLIANENGVTSSGGENDIVLTIPEGIYTTSTLLGAINTTITNYSGLVNVESGFSSVETSEGINYTRIKNVLYRKYDERDYNLVFYDNLSFAECFTGASSVQNTTWDTTVGWILGFRDFTSYDLSAFYDSTNGFTTITGDTGVSTSLFNYFLLCLDDFNQSRLNDGLVTITDVDESIPLPSYAKRSNFFCNPATGEKVYNNTAGLTEKQVYAANEIANSSTNNALSVGSSVSTKSYGKGPYASDVFGLIPIKTSSLSPGQPYVEFGGSLQNQERSYFGPVNISRMSVKLVSDRGNSVDLNNANWSFSLICEQLNKLEPKN